MTNDSSTVVIRGHLVRAVIDELSGMRLTFRDGEGCKDIVEPDVQLSDVLQSIKALVVCVTKTGLPFDILEESLSGIIQEGILEAYRQTEKSEV